MDIVIAGPGEVVIRFIDAEGRTLLQEKITVSGSPSVQGRRTIPLHLDTTSGRVLVSPVLVRHSNPEQRVTFDNEPAARFTARRCQDIGCTREVLDDVERGCAASGVQGDTAVVMSDDQVVYRVIRDVLGKDHRSAP